MPRKVSDPMEYDELLNNYEFKIAKRMLKQDYPWVKDVFIKVPEEINDYNLIFVDILFDPFLLGRQEDWTVSPYITKTIIDGKEYWSPYISSFYSNASFDDAKPFMEELNEKLYALHLSAALPTDLRLPSTRTLQVGSYFANPTSCTPEDTTP